MDECIRLRWVGLGGVGLGGVRLCVGLWWAVFGFSVFQGKEEEVRVADAAGAVAVATRFSYCWFDNNRRHI